MLTQPALIQINIDVFAGFFSRRQAMGGGFAFGHDAGEVDLGQCADQGLAVTFGRFSICVRTTKRGFFAREQAVLRSFTGLAACLVVAASPVIVQAQQSPGSPPAQGVSDATRAKALLMRMADYVATAQEFSVTVDASYDVVQESGQKIEFGEIRHVILKRPDDLRVDVEQRDGGKEQIFFDGQKLTLFSPGENIYASLTRPGSVDDTIDYFIYNLQTRLPLSVLLETSLPQVLNQGVTGVATVDDETLAGREVEHLAARAKNVDFQVWIATGDEPVPLRVLLTYKFAPGQPQFSASLSDWNFHPKIDPSAFVFVPPAGAESVAFMVPTPKTPVRAGAGGQ